MNGNNCPKGQLKFHFSWKWGQKDKSDGFEKSLDEREEAPLWEEVPL